MTTRVPLPLPLGEGRSEGLCPTHRPKAWNLSVSIFLLLSTFGFETSHAAEALRPDIVVADFEGEDYGEWNATGDAFGNKPALGTLPGQQVVSGFAGKGLVNTFRGGDDATGALVSPTFRIERKYINLLVGGGRHPGDARVDLLVDEKLVGSETGTASTGADDEHLSWRSWNVSNLAGKEARIAITDNATGNWGHINVDHIVQSDVQKAHSSGNDAIDRAMASVEGATARAQADPARPAFHLMPPALWCNDPNGPIHVDAWYHVFYQHNPYGDRWEHMHWGHARSRDLIHWEHLPIALWPSVERGENHCFSGSATINDKGQVMLFYTSIGDRGPEQWASVTNDKDLLTWSKHPSNPILTEASHGETKIDDWRDPFIFDADGKKWMVVGGHPKGGKGGICLYEAQSSDLAKWKFRGVAFQGEEDNWECPNLFRVGERWLLLYSPHSQVRYQTGSLDLDRVKFEPSQNGIVDWGGDFYATSVLKDDQGRWILWGWIRGFPGGRGWNGCLSLPREIEIADEGRLLQRPVRELEKLRTGDPKVFESIELANSSRVLGDDFGNQLEIEWEVTLGTAERCGIKLLRSKDGKNGATITVDAKGIEVAGVRVPMEIRPNEPLRLHIYLDRSVLEVFTPGACATKVVTNDPINGGIEVFSSEGRAIVSFTAWKLGPSAQ